MCNGFLFERGKLLFEEGETDPFAFNERSKSAEHSSAERSKNSFSAETKNSQKSEKNEDIKS